MQFHGELLGLQDGHLQLQADGDSGPVLGIPMEEITSLRPDRLPDDPVELLLEFENCHEVLPYFPDPVLEGLMENILAEATQWSWQEYYQWTDRFVRAFRSPVLKRSAVLLKCRALLAMGQLGQMERLLDNLVASTDALHASPLLCALNAARYGLAGNTEEEAFWASLPALHIPPQNIPVVLIPGN